jgi:hypothetical protein
MNTTTQIDRNTELYEYLRKFSPHQFKVFYGIFVHCWAHKKGFISKRSFFNLWCELNQLCYEADDSFPDMYDNHLEIKFFCQAHPYYFIDILPIDTIAKLFSEYCNERLDILLQLAKILYKQNHRAAYKYIIDTLRLDHSVDEILSDSEAHIKSFS